jgi:hypothetical protein
MRLVKVTLVSLAFMATMLAVYLGPIVLATYLR